MANPQTTGRDRSKAETSPRARAAWTADGLDGDDDAPFFTGPGRAAGAAGRPVGAGKASAPTRTSVAERAAAGDWLTSDPDEGEREPAERHRGEREPAERQARHTAERYTADRYPGERPTAGGKPARSKTAPGEEVAPGAKATASTKTTANGKTAANGAANGKTAPSGKTTPSGGVSGKAAAGARTPGTGKAAGLRKGAAAGGEPAQTAVTPKSPRLRLLPVVIFAAALMTTLKLNGIVEGFAGQGPGAVTVEQSQAVAQPTRPTPPQAPPPSPAGRTSVQVSQVPAARASGGDASPLLANAPPGDGPEPAAFTQSEIDILQQLAVRREELERRGAELDRREAMLDAAEDRINGKIAEIKVLERTIEKLIAKYNENEENKIKSLVNIYEKMKPKDAARIFNELEMPMLIAVVEHMKDAKMALIMAEMDSPKAKALTTELAIRNRLPIQVGVATGGG